MAQSASIITVYLVGNSKEQALAGLLWDDQRDAEEYARENDYQHIYRLQKVVYADDLESVFDLDAEDQ